MKALSIIGLASILALSACGGGGGGGSDAPRQTEQQQQTAQTQLFSAWYHPTDPEDVIDLSNGNMDTIFKLDLVMRNNKDKCSCQLQLSGTDSSGQLTIGNCTYINVTNEVPVFTVCEQLSETGTYQLIGGKLRLCSSGNECDDYQRTRPVLVNPQPPAPANKSIFSYWEGTDLAFDFRNRTLGAQEPMPFYLLDGAQCDCDLVLSGYENRGDFFINSCTYKPWSGRNGDPGCSQINQAGSYNITDNQLTMCTAMDDGSQVCKKYK